MKEMEDFIITLLKDVNDLLYGKDEEPETEECPSDKYGNTWQSRARRLEEKVRALEVDLQATGGEREYFKSRVDSLNTEIDILNAEVERLQEELRSYTEDVKEDEALQSITEEPAPWSFAKLMDRDGDLWSQRTTISGRLWHCETVTWAQPLSFSDLKDTYGPLRIPPHRSK